MIYNTVPLYHAVFSAEKCHPKNRAIEGEYCSTIINKLKNLENFRNFSTYHKEAEYFQNSPEFVPDLRRCQTIWSS